MKNLAGTITAWIQRTRARRWLVRLFAWGYALIGCLQLADATHEAIADTRWTDVFGGYHQSASSRIAESVAVLLFAAGLYWLSGVRSVPVRDLFMFMTALTIAFAASGNPFVLITISLAVGYYLFWTFD